MDLEEDMKFEEPFYDIKSPKPTDLPNDRYTILKNLVEGESNYSFVYSCTDTNNGKIKALKFIKLTEKLIDRIKNEITIMRILHHPNIIQMERYFRTGPYVCVVLPYSPHRSLAWILTQYYRDGMDEEIAVDMMKQMLKAVQYLHLNNICHRDIKPDNFLIFDDPNNSDSDSDDTDSDYIYSPIVVLTDFGFAKHFNPKELFKDYLGTYDYLAPEIVEDKPYDCSVDIWALGIVLFKMLAGDLPFTSFHLSPKACYSHITTGNFNYDMLKHKNVSHEAIDLIQKMCNIDPKKRIKAELALKHPWILKSEKPQIVQDITALMGSPEEYVNSAPGT